MGLRDLVLAQDVETPLVRRGGPGGHGVGLRDLRRMRAGVPGLDRARRSHRRSAPPPRDGRVELPGRGRADAPRRRARLEPVGEGPVRARRLGGRPGRQDSRAGRPRPRVPLLGRLRLPRSTSEPERPRGATAKLLQSAGVDFAILGPRESCTGDPARRIGNEYVFQAFAEQNVETLNEAGVTKIVTGCPHCFNTLGNEYPDFGGKLRSDPPLRAALKARPRRPDQAVQERRRPADHLPRLVLPRAPQRRGRSRRGSSSPPSETPSR